VSALLINPFASDTASDNTAIRSRWDDHGDRVHGLSIQLQNGQREQAQVEDNTSIHPILHVRSPFLSHFSLPIQITEIRSPQVLPFHTPETSSGRGILDEGPLANLLKADIPIIVCNPLTTSLTQLAPLLTHLANPNTVVVLTAPPHPDLVEPIQSLFRRSRSRGSTSEAGSGLRIAFIDPQRALSAIDALEHNPASAPAIQRFQDDIVGSRLSSLTDALGHILASYGSREGAGRSQARALMRSTAHARLQSALLACRAAIDQAETEVQHVRARTRELRGRVEETRARALRSVLFPQPDFPSPPISTTSSETETTDVVHKALQDAEREMGAVMRRLTWWRMVWRVDEIGSIVGDAVQRVWCRDLERHVRTSALPRSRRHR
jgi:hypothetical protein